MSLTMTRRHLMRLAAAPTLAVAMAGALRAEGLVTPAAAVADLPYANRTPIRCGEVALRVRDLDTMTAFYRTVLGLKVMQRSDQEAVMGIDGQRLLHLQARPDAVLEPMTEAGLFHTAFLMPSAKDLARWLVHIARLETPITGFADHRVSEAVYLDDPEGNGIEVYRDRPQEEWLWVAGEVVMGTEQLDLDRLLALTDTNVDDYHDAPEGLRIGHIHLRVGDIAQARGFYQQLVGLEVTAFSGRGSAFLSSGRYHHHLGMNIWNSRGAGMRDAARTGLARFSLLVSDPALLQGQQDRLGAAGLAVQSVSGGLAVADPWGTRVELIGV